MLLSGVGIYYYRYANYYFLLNGYGNISFEQVYLISWRKVYYI